MVDELSNGMVLMPAFKHQKIHARFGVPRDNHQARRTIQVALGQISAPSQAAAGSIVSVL
jgi:hypothetical protein